MKYIITILSSILFISFANAQNIVPNYSFEEADSCPKFLNDRSYEYSLGCVGWGQATSAWSDYFNACDTAAVSIGEAVPWVGVPYNFIGHQNACEGVAYTGINMYSVPIPQWKSYLIANIPALEPDTAYEVTIHVCLASYCEFAADGFGVLFTTYGSPSQFIDSTIDVRPQIDYTNYGVITDSVNWTTLTAAFVADSAYTSIIIGGFRHLGEMNILTVNNPTSNPHDNSFYYIDNVVVQKLSSTGTNILSSGNEKVSAYPNPFTDHTTMIFNNSGSQNYTLKILNALGETVQRLADITSNRIRIERNGLPPGFYYYQLSNQDNVVANGKLAIN